MKNQDLKAIEGVGCMKKPTNETKGIIDYLINDNYIPHNRKKIMAIITIPWYMYIVLLYKEKKYFVYFVDELNLIAYKTFKNKIYIL